MSTTTAADEAPIGTNTRVTPTDSSDDHPSDENSTDDAPFDEDPVGTRTRVQ